jgi:hypothetical protein
LNIPKDTSLKISGYTSGDIYENKEERIADYYYKNISDMPHMLNLIILSENLILFGDHEESVIQNSVLFLHHRLLLFTA